MQGARQSKDQGKRMTQKTTQPCCEAGEGFPLARHVRGGFTMIELLVVIGIIVVLVAILIPAVAKVRIAARTAETTSELKDLAAAIEAAGNGRLGGRP